MYIITVAYAFKDYENSVSTSFEIKFILKYFVIKTDTYIIAVAYAFKYYENSVSTWFWNKICFEIIVNKTDTRYILHQYLEFK